MGNTGNSWIRTLTRTIGAVALLAATLSPLAAAGRAEDDLPLDLAAMTLLPDDLVAEGMEGYGASFSILTDDMQAVADFLDDWGWDASVPDGEAIIAADPERMYLMQLSRDIRDGAMLSSSHLVPTFMMEFEDDEAAADGFAEMADLWGDADLMSEADTTVDIGDEQLLIEGQGVDPGNDREYPRMSLIFRVDELIAGVSIHNYNNDEPPTQDQIEGLAIRQLDLVEGTLGKGGPGFSGQAVRLRVPGIMALYDQYLVVDGKAIRRGFHTDEQIAQAQAGFTKRGVVDQYMVDQLIAGDPRGDEGPFAYFNVNIVRFMDEDHAIADLHATIDHYESGGFDDQDVMSTDKVRGLGDEAFAVTFTAPFDGTMRVNSRVLVREGNVMFFLTHVTETEKAGTQRMVLETAPDAVMDLAEQQFACLTGEDICDTTIRIPRDMRAKWDQGGIVDPGIVANVPVRKMVPAL